MKLDEFYRNIENMILFPGGLAELNQLERISGSHRVYEFLPQKDANKFITGIYLPLPDEVKDKESCEMLLGILKFADKEENELTADEIKGDLTELLTPLISMPEIMKQDIRLKAKKLGAHGLVYYQWAGQNAMSFRKLPITSVSLNLYIGVPVKLTD